MFVSSHAGEPEPRALLPAVCLGEGLRRLCAACVIAACLVAACLGASAMAADSAGERRPAPPSPSLEEDNRSGRLDEAGASPGVEAGPGRAALPAPAAGGDRVARLPKPAARAKPRQSVPLRKANVVEQIRHTAFSTEKGR